MTTQTNTHDHQSTTSDIDGIRMEKPFRPDLLAAQMGTQEHHPQ